jgi:tetratricopeptide (TPR) repeat protein
MIKRKYSNLNKEIIQHRLFLPILVFVGILLVFPIPIRMVHSLYLQARLSEAIDLLNSGRNEINGFLFTCEPLDENDSETERLMKQIITDVSGSISPTKWNSHAYLQIGWLYCMHGEPAQALEYYQQFIDMRPSNPLGHLEIGFVFEKLGDAEGAVLHWDLTGNNFSEFHQLGLSALNDGDNEEALLWFTRTIWLNPNYPDSWINIAEVYKGLNDPNNALQALWEAYRINSEIGVLPLVEHLVELGEITESIELLFAALDEYPESKNRLNWWMVLANSLMEMQALEEAIEVYQDAIAEFPKEIDLYISLGWLYYDYKEDFTSALNLFNQAIEVDPDRGAGYYAVGVLLNREGKYNEAETWLAEAVFKEPRRTWYVIVRANNLRSGGFIHESISVYKSILEENPNYHYAYFELSLAYYNLEEMELARDAIANAIMIVPSPTMAYFNRAGRIFEALEDFETSVYYFEKTLELSPDNQSALEGLDRVKRITDGQ